MNKPNYSVDLSVNFQCSDQTIEFIEKFFSIDKIGTVSAESSVDKRNSLILKIRNTDFLTYNSKADYPYLLYIGPEQKRNSKFSECDIVMVGNLTDAKLLLQKHSGKNLGFEFFISDLKDMNANEIGRWFSDIKYFYGQCKRYKHQLILSSGARNIFELVSLRVFNSILCNLGIKSIDYWSDLNQWLIIKSRGGAYDTN